MSVSLICLTDGIGLPAIKADSMYAISSIRVLVTEIIEKFLVASAQTHGHGEETQSSSGWTLIESELSSPNFNSSVRAK